MAIHKVAKTSDDIIYGLCVVQPCTSPNGSNYKYNPGQPLSNNLGSGHAIGFFSVLDGRFKVGPSGWSG